MFIIHGTTRKVRNLGCVADFCPICRSIQAFDLKRLGLASHIYFISLGEGKLTGHIIQCRRCGVQLKAEPETYSAREKRHARIIDVESLIHSTYPNIREVYARRLAFEERLKKSPGDIPPEMRAEYMMEPFRLLNPGVEETYKGQTNFDKQSSIGCIGTMASSIGLCALGLYLHDRANLQSTILGIMSACFVVGTIYTVVQLFLARGRYVRTKVMPKLVQSLSPFHPLSGEVSALLEKCKTGGLLIGKKLKIDRVMKELEAAPK